MSASRAGIFIYFSFSLLFLPPHLSAAQSVSISTPKERTNKEQLESGKARRGGAPGRGESNWKGGGALTKRETKPTNLSRHFFWAGFPQKVAKRTELIVKEWCR
jgi:hypothetical protein